MSETTKVKPALTSEQWARIQDEPWGKEPHQVGYEQSGAITLDGSWDRHELAARALHDQPFGFRWEDVDRCRARAAAYEAEHDVTGELADYEDQQYWEGLADRIEALLPPRP